MILWYPLSGYIEVETLHNGKKVGNDFFEKNPHLKDTYPTQDEFQVTYNSVLREVEKTGKCYKITNSEAGISVTFDQDMSEALAKH